MELIYAAIIIVIVYDVFKWINRQRRLNNSQLKIEKLLKNKEHESHQQPHSTDEEEHAHWQCSECGVQWCLRCPVCRQKTRSREEVKNNTQRFDA